MSEAQTQMDEIGAMMLFVVATILLSAAAVIEAVTKCLRVADLANDALANLASELNETRKASFEAKEVREPAYIVQTGGDSAGPFPVDKIKELRRRGAIDDDTPVALAGRNEWKRTCEVIGI